MKTFILTIVGLVTLVMFAVGVMAQTTNDLPKDWKLQCDGIQWRVVTPRGYVLISHCDTKQGAVDYAIRTKEAWDKEEKNEPKWKDDAPQPIDPPPAKPSTNSAGLALSDCFSPCGDADIKCWYVPEVLTNWVDVKEDGTDVLQAGVITSNYLLLAQWRETPIHTNVLFTSNLVLQSLPMRVVPKPSRTIIGSNIWWNSGFFLGTNSFITN